MMLLTGSAPAAQASPGDPSAGGTSAGDQVRACIRREFRESVFERRAAPERCVPAAAATGRSSGGGGGWAVPERQRGRVLRGVSMTLRMRLLVAVFVAVSVMPPAADAEARPNIVIILADDLGYGDLACYGHPQFPTPHLDHMAATGARLTQFNTPMAFCAPTRAALLTGRYPFRNGMTGNPAPDGRPAADELALSPDEITLAELFRAAGYATGMVGKWHLGHQRAAQMPTGRGFREYLGILYSNDMRPVQLRDGFRVVEDPVDQSTLTQRYTDRAVDFIRRHRSRPFFLYLAHAMPHKPLATSEEFAGKSAAGLYGDVVMELDAGVGRVLSTLKTLGLDEQTLVIFTSDNGPWFGGSTGGLRGMKGSSWEGGYRVPCIARWPGQIPEGHVNHAPAVMMDLFSTVLNAAGVPLPSDRTIDGRDIMGLFQGDAPSPHPVVIGHQGQTIATIRDDRWKLHLAPARDPFLRLSRREEPWVDPRGPDGTTILAPPEQYQPSAYPGLRSGVAPAAGQLFDLRADPGEQVDVAEQHPEIVSRLRSALSELTGESEPEHGR